MLERNVIRLIWGVSVFVFLAVVFLKLIPAPSYKPSFIYVLPHLIGGINATCAALLCMSFVFIKNKKVEAHKITNFITLGLSSIFLVLYILFHIYEQDTKYGDVDHNGIVSATEAAAIGTWRYIYLFILATHILLSASVLPFILLSFYRGLNMQIPQHKKLVRWAFPIWLYVAVTGVVVYVMISPYYNF